MCDTFVVLPGHTINGNLIFGKNSDREPNEAQAIERVPASTHRDRWLQCTYIRIPQVKETAEMLLSRPFQMWGAEMGVNEYGVVIGNEAVFTRVPMPRRNEGLTGMDLLRLALERCRTAESALQCITELLEEYGQNACGGYHNRRFFYHNSFLIADAADAWLLETAGRHWAARRVGDLAAISNGLTIEEDYDLISAEAVDYAHRNRLLRRRESFGFTRAYSDWFMTRMSRCRHRRRQSTQQLQAADPGFTVEDAMALLRSHDQSEDSFEPARASTASICMHATGLINPGQTTGSLVAEIRSGKPSTVWLTGTSMPCLSVFKPFFLGGNMLSNPPWPIPGSQVDRSLWWQAETVHRRITTNYQQGKRFIKGSQLSLQHKLLQREKELIGSGAGIKKLDRLSWFAVEQHRICLRNAKVDLDRTTLKKGSRNPLFWRYRKQTDIRAGLKK